VSHPALARLGPDLLKPDFDPAAARRRLRERGALEIAVALMDQTALAGIGNVYKSEVLFLGGVSPLARVGELDDVTLDRLVATARDLMRRNLGSGVRRTTTALSSGFAWVYRRSGQPCRKCGTAIRRVVQGDEARSTYFCPACQRGGALASGR
jgi:endonuclease-8